MTIDVVFTDFHHDVFVYTIMKEENSTMRIVFCSYVWNKTENEENIQHKN